MCTKMGTPKRKIYYGYLDELEEKAGIESPYCIIIPGKMHFVEKDVLETFRINKKE